MLQELFARALDNMSYSYMRTQKKRRGGETFFIGALEEYLEDRALDDPRTFFRNPGVAPDMHMLDATRRGSYVINKYRFQSFVESPHQFNDQVHFRFYERHGEPDAPTVIVLHGYRMENYMVFDRYCRLMVRRGYNAALVDLPYHMSRRPPGTYHGEFTFSDDGVLTLRVMQQSVLDIMAVINWLKLRGAPRIGMFGVSYGGMLSGLMACVEPQVDFTVMVAPPADMGAVFFESRLGRQFEAENPRAREVMQKYKDVLDRFALINLKPLTPHENILLIEGTFDGMVPVDLVEKLWRAWDKPQIHRYPQGHLSVIIFNPPMDRHLRAFLKKMRAKAPGNNM
jgi:dipeptidyl aminopeptidase/acylaminoacyl peptidase